MVKPPLHKGGFQVKYPAKGGMGMNNAVVTLREGQGRALKAGGPWVYDNEVGSIEGLCADGDIVTVRDAQGKFLCQGFINRKSKLLVRVMSRDESAVIDREFLRMRVRNAWEYRKKTVDTACCRVIFGEADFLPGLVVDKFADVLVVQSLALGIDRLKAVILELLLETLAADGISIRGVYERSDALVREREGLPLVTGFLGDGFDTKVEIVENGVRYLVDVAEGQKTGFFLDQKYNRRAIRPLCRGAKVLDCFTHTGSFALNAAQAGAKSVLAVDASELAIAQARENAALNGLDDRVRFQCADVFELLPELIRKKEKFDLVILDPPAFAKSRGAVKNAVKGYRQINLRALQLVRDGGYLATCSCSHFVDAALLGQTVRQAANNVRKRLRQVEFRTQAPDHPILWGAEDSDYLKFFIFQVCAEK